jgi:hypothetical protein
MLAKLSESVRPHIREADQHDPISIMLELKLTCGGINTTTIADQKSKFQALLIGENESATNFLTRALLVFDSCVTFGIHYSEEDYVDKILHALRGNQTYNAERGRLLDRRRMEQQNTYRSHHVEPLTVREIVHIMNNVDGEIYEGSVNRKPRRQRNEPNSQRNNRYHANQAQAATQNQAANQANVATPRNNQYQRVCFHCKSQDHGINQCPIATDAQKEACWARFFAEKATNQPKRKSEQSGQADTRFVSNRFTGTNSGSNSSGYTTAVVAASSNSSKKRVKFNKNPRSHHANVITVTSEVVNYNGETNLTAPGIGPLKGIPPVHQAQLGQHPMNYWLLDAGTSAHMTPYRTDIDTNSFRPVSNGFVKVANNQHEPIIGIGNVTILIKCYETGLNITWTLFNVLVVPTIVRRLITTDELNDAGHSIAMESSGIVITLREQPNIRTQSKVTVIRYPRTWEYDEQTSEYQWSIVEYQQAVRNSPNGYLVSPVSMNLMEEPTASANAVEADNNGQHQHDDNALEPDSEPDDDSSHDTETESSDNSSDTNAENQAKKRAVHLQTVHNRLGHRSIESLLLGHRDNIWNDMKIQRDPENICQTCQITLARKTARNKKTAADRPDEPGRMVTIDIISNPFDSGLNKKSYFAYYLLLVDVYSTLPVLFGLKSLTAHNIIRTLKMYLATIKPKLNAPRPPGEINGHHLQHIRADAGAQFTSAEFLQACHDEGINVSLAAPKHQEMNGLCERTWQSIHNLAFSFMNYTRVGEEFGSMALEHTWKVFAVLPIKGLRKKCNATTPFELFYGTKPSVRKFRILFCPCVYKVYIRTKTISSKTVRHFDAKTHPQRGVIGLFCGFPRSQAGYIIWEPRSKKACRLSGRTIRRKVS